MERFNQESSLFCCVSGRSLQLWSVDGKEGDWNQQTKLKSVIEILAHMMQYSIATTKIDLLTY